MQNNAGLILLIVAVAALAYLRIQQPDTWNQYLQMLKAKAQVAPADALPVDAANTTSTGT